MHSQLAKDNPLQAISLSSVQGVARLVMESHSTSKPELLMIFSTSRVFCPDYGSPRHRTWSSDITMMCRFVMYAETLTYGRSTIHRIYANWIPSYAGSSTRSETPNDKMPCEANRGRTTPNMELEASHPRALPEDLCLKLTTGKEG
jgi:hypothetical protein